MALLLRWCSGLRANRAGSASSEFALVVPLLATLMFGIIEFGTVVYSYTAMQFGASIAARQMAVNVSDATAAQAAARAALPGWARNDVAIQITQSDPGDANTNMIRVRLTVNAADVAAIAMITRMVPWALTADASIKQELPYVD